MLPLEIFLTGTGYRASRIALRSSSGFRLPVYIPVLPWFRLGPAIVVAKRRKLAIRMKVFPGSVLHAMLVSAFGRNRTVLVVRDKQAMSDPPVSVLRQVQLAAGSSC